MGIIMIGNNNRLLFRVDGEYTYTVLASRKRRPAWNISEYSITQILARNMQFQNYNRKLGECYNYLANEPFERNWRRRLRHGYYSTDVASTGKLSFGDQQSHSPN